MPQKLLLSSLLIASVVSHAEPTNSESRLPNIGEPAEQYLSPEEERLLGQRFARSLYRQKAVLDEPEITTYLQSLANRLSSGIDTPPLKVLLIRSEQINAFAVPGGLIGINAGLILATRNEGQLASVIAHEIAHITQRHIARRYARHSETGWAELGTLLASLALATQGHGTEATAALLAGTAAQYQRYINYTRTQEQEADRIGIGYLARANFDPKDMAGFFEVMRNQDLSTATQLEILRTHPLDDNRIAEAKARAAQWTKINPPDDKRYQQMKNYLLTLITETDPLFLHYQKAKQPLTEIELYTYSQLLIDRRRYLSAEDILHTLLDKHPEDIHYRLTQIRLYLAHQQVESAKHSLEKLLSIYPNYPPIVIYYTRALEQLKQYPDCINTIENFRQHTSELPVTLLALLAECLAHNTQEAYSQLVQGQYFFRTGNLQAATLQINAALSSKSLNALQQQQAQQLLKIIKSESLENR